MPASRVLLAAAVLALLPLPAFAQSRTALPQVGQHGLTFAVPNGGGAAFGIRKMLSPRANDGLEVGLGLSRSHTSGQSATTHENVSVRPGVRLYEGTAGPVVPFLHLFGVVSYDKQGSAWSLSGGAGAGIGVEWFFADRVSLSGYTGAAVTVGHTHGNVAPNDFIGFGSSTSGLALTLYF